MIAEWERNTISLEKKKKLHSEWEKTAFIDEVNADVAGLGELWVLMPSCLVKASRKTCLLGLRRLWMALWVRCLQSNVRLVALV